MNVIATALPEVLILEPRLFGDQRGFFLETYQLPRYAEHGISLPFVQDNMSRSSHGVLRGLHLQNPFTQGKLVTALRAGFWMWRWMCGWGARVSDAMLP
ncbi:dTDP-4-dehydrorhamnose 3,5-epimerase [Bradyrhizobium sp. AZCC 1577]